MRQTLLIALLPLAAIAAETPVKPAKAAMPPTAADVAYGTHERQVLDFYKAASDKPTPLLFFVHGGGWTAGDKDKKTDFKAYLDKGISVVSINYRYTWQAQVDGIHPPVKAPLEDAARALQFVRSKAAEWNIDKTRVATTGGSAGACTSLWLAMHDDMADPKSSDPIARESTRLLCAAGTRGQTSLDPQQCKEWTPNSRYGGHAFGFMDPASVKSRDTLFAEFLSKREELLPLIREYSPIEHASADDPPIYLIYTTLPAMGQPEKDPTHSANYGVPLHAKLTALKVPCKLVHPGAPDTKHPTSESFLIDMLKK
ncbi:alpha/beta hydrolase [Luteolibacter sp. SL250]|uniref:alpha/beta hydrolase n=1 Tax=Luteolibacter sp. SL250 TaxID=2995170 RepID=UPI00226E25DF|nr:alpha/beta hydrolase [Luteolibacter sp. SL250]WAC20730.1 alpha/beta hydrolase [Luteolibacter sp. SL250]